MTRNEMPSTSDRLLAYIAVLAVATLLAACGSKDTASAAAPNRPPPPEVGVVTATLQPVVLQTELPGRVEPLRVAQVEARASTASC